MRLFSTGQLSALTLAAFTILGAALPASADGMSTARIIRPALVTGRLVNVEHGVRVVRPRGAGSHAGRMSVSTMTVEIIHRTAAPSYSSDCWAYGDCRGFYGTIYGGWRARHLGSMRMMGVRRVGHR